jgi:nucleoside-triphosphatase THEP1
MITLTKDQAQAKREFLAFLSNDQQSDFVLTGYAGTGKTTLVGVILDELPKMLSTINMLTQSHDSWELLLCAMTNKAADVFSCATGKEALTVHKAFGFKLENVDNLSRRKRTVDPDTNHKIKKHIIFIDEVSQMDTKLLQLVRNKCENCKIVYIGDPAQLTPVGSSVAPIFRLGFPTAGLTKIMRQEVDNPIIQLSAKFRDTVNGLGWFQTALDGNALVELDRTDFENAIVREFNSGGSGPHSSTKVLAYTNQCVINYNRGVRQHIMGSADLQTGDYAMVNTAVYNNCCKLGTDEEVCVMAIQQVIQLGLQGKMYFVNSYDGKNHKAFMPDSELQKKALLKQARKDENYDLIREVDKTWIDLRASYACTINKSQGSTYDRVYIDLDDVSKCRSGNQMARLMYVAVSRARYQVFFTGSLTSVAKAA